MDVLATTYSPIPALRGGGGSRGAAVFPSNQHHLLKSPFSYPYLFVSKPSSSLSFSSKSLSQPPPTTLAGQSHHKGAATGYAAALIDFSRRNGSTAFNAIIRDVRRLTIAVAEVLEDHSMNDEEQDDAIRGVVGRAGFDRRLVALVRMVTTKGKGPGAIAGVLKEFWRMWGEMNAAAEGMEVVVASERKMRVEELAKIAGEMQRARGVDLVKIKHLFVERDMDISRV
ncbi:hypothetical protein KSP39_PZI009929 [Platanthera zijinensis]|uniref:Uncharacterized protein n=1 Tax=Platanthera zijinensis TaxID=2320716 RepID=A0AAP0BIS2_9ASPA